MTKLVRGSCGVAGVEGGLATIASPVTFIAMKLAEIVEVISPL